MHDILTTEEAAAMMRLSIPTLRGMAASGEIPAVQMGEWKFLKTQLLDYMSARAKEEQRRRQESHAAEQSNPAPRTEPPKRGRPSKKVDLRRYQ